MALDLVAKLMLKTGAFSSDLGRARSEIQSFKQGCNDASKSFQGFAGGLGMNLGMITKLGSVIGIATAAGYGFKEVLSSTQSTGDEFNKTIASAKGVLSTFAQSLATFDFSAFNNGLGTIIANARNLYDALDQLGNTTMSYDFISGENAYLFEQQKNIYRDVNSTPEQKKEAMKKMKELRDKENQYRNALNETTLQAFQKEIGALVNGYFDSSKVRYEDFYNALMVDLSKDPSGTRREFIRRKKEYDEKVKDLGPVKETSWSWTKGIQHHITDPYKEQRDKITEEYIGDIVKWAMLQAEGDDNKLKEIISRFTKVNSANRNYEAMNAAIIKLEKGEKIPKIVIPKITTPKTEKEITYQEGSLNYYKALSSSLQKQRDDTTIATEKWKEYNDQLKEVNEMIDIISGKEKSVAPQPAEGSYNYLSNLSNQYKTMRDNLKYQSEEWEKYDKLLKGVNDELEKMSGKNITIKVETDELSDQLSALKDLNSVFNSLSQSAKLFGDSAGNAFQAVFDIIGTLTSGISQLMTIQDMAAKKNIANKTQETAANIAETSSEVGAAMAKGTSSAASLPFPYNIAAIATVIATIVGIAATIKNATAGNFAEGGIVGGTSWSGDKLRVGINSGEMVLTKKQQSNLFKQLNSNRYTPQSATGGEVQFKISGNNLVGVLNNNLKKQKILG